MSENNSLPTRSAPRLPPSGPSRRQRLFLAHPDPSPEKTTGPLWIEAPNKLSSTASWLQFTESISLLMSQHPDNSDLPLHLTLARTVLAWRRTVLPEDRFWKPD